MGNGEPVLGSLYVYAPNKVAPIVFAIAYALSCAGHLWQCWRYKCFKLVGLHPLCAGLFALGYALREYGSYHYTYSSVNLIIFILSQVFIYVCPPLLELANYHVLGRIFQYVPHLSPFSPGKVLSLFGALMLIIETLNALGVSLAANTSSSLTQQELGSRLTIAALSMQLGVILIFIMLAVTFHRRCVRTRVQARAIPLLLNVMYVSMTLILVRCIYRLVEHVGSTTVDIENIQTLRNLSPVMRYEPFFIVFESVLMLVNSLIWNIWNPGRYLPSNYHMYLADDGQTEIEGEILEDNRTVWEKAGNIATFGLLFGAARSKPSMEELRNYPRLGGPQPQS